MPGDPTTEFSVLPDGSRTVIPILAGTRAAGQSVEITGAVRCAYTNRRYDALYECDASGAADVSRPHAYLSWQPRTPEIEARDVQSHRYVFRVPAAPVGAPSTVAVDVDRFVRDLLIPPSDVRRSLSGGFRAAVMPTPVTSPWPRGILAAAAPALLLTGGIAWVIRRRIANPTLDYDLQVQLGRIGRKARAARAAVRREDLRLVQVSARLDALEAGASRLANHAQRLRGVMALQSRVALQNQAEDLRRQTERGNARIELLQTLREKEQALGAVIELEEATAVCMLRLTRIEAAVESGLAGLHAIQIQSTETGGTDAVCAALDAEVSALREATSLEHDQCAALAVRR